jgi:hypothetical protein
VGDPATRLADLTITAGDPYSAISPYVLRVRSARVLTAGRDVVIASEGDFGQMRVMDYGWTSASPFDDADTGDVTYGVLGIREDMVRWYKVPADSDTCRMHVYRLPFPRLPAAASSLDGTQALEVREEHHLALVDWMKHRAYLKPDAEVYDKKAADACEARFNAYCERARRERERRVYKPRVVQYGGL